MAVVGVDLGHKTLAKGSDSSELEQTQFYHDMEQKPADAARQDAAGQDDQRQDQ